MKAVVSSESGNTPPVGKFAAPQVRGDEIIVEVLAAGIKKLERAIVAGTHYSSPKKLPFVPGTDGVGLTPDPSGSPSPPFASPAALWPSMRRPRGASPIPTAPACEGRADIARAASPPRLAGRLAPRSGARPAKPTWQ